MPRSNTCHGLKLDKPSFCLIDNSLSYSIFFLAFGLLNWDLLCIRFVLLLHFIFVSAIFCDLK